MKLNLKAAAAVIQQAKTNEEDASEHHILIVDDEAPNLQGLARQLVAHYRVTTFTSAREALKKIDEGGPDVDFSVVISDQIMPEMSGVEFLSQLQKRRHPAPRIMLTGYAALENVVSAVNDAAIFRYVTKPVSGETLSQVIREAIDHYEMRKENGRLITMAKELLEKNAELQKKIISYNPESASEDLSLEIFPPRRHQVTVIFAEIKGLSEQARKTEPETVISIMDKVFRPLHEIIYNAGGVVDKHLGHGLMALFGLTGGATIHAAATATQQMVGRVAGTLKTLDPPFDQLKVSIGVASGTVVMGLVGSLRRTEFAVVGETANLAARLQEAGAMVLDNADKQKVFGECDRVVAICTDNMLEAAPQFKRVEVPESMNIRDFSEIREVGVLTT
jgi:class 3 adenylate cyclase